MNEERLQMSESFLLAALLAIVGGFLDAYSYLLRGHVFANAQTGNIVLFGVYLQKGDVEENLILFYSYFGICPWVILVEIVKSYLKKKINFTGDNELSF
mgnify:CR=1 FL=1